MTKQRNVGDIISVTTGKDAFGRHYWFETTAPQAVHGPFATEAASDEHQRLTLLGPQCEISCGGLMN